MSRIMCVYCGVASATTSDHVPPKQLLLKPYRPNLRTVPSCSACNEELSLDEEYFRLVVVGLFCHGSEADAVFDEPMTRSFERRPQLEERMWASLGAEGGRPFVQIDTTRFIRVVTKIIRGLHFDRYKSFLPLEVPVKVQFFTSENLPQAVIRAFEKTGYDIIDSPSFAYSVKEDDPAYSHIWHLVFFGEWHCIAGYEIHQ